MDSLQTLDPKLQIGRTFTAAAYVSGAKSQAYTASLRFLVGKNKVGDMTLPLYIPRGEANQTQAQELAESIGRDVNITGEMDIAALIRSNKLPLRKYIKDAVDAMKEEHGLPDNPPYKVNFTKDNRLDLRLIDDAHGTEHRFYVPLPSPPASAGVAYAQRFRGDVQRIVTDLLGTEHLRDRSTSGATRRAAGSKDKEFRVAPQAEWVHINKPRQSSLYLLRIQGGNRESPYHNSAISVRLGTPDEATAGKRRDAIVGYINRQITEKGVVRLSEIRTFADGLIEQQATPATGQEAEADPTPHLRRVSGPVILYANRGTNRDPDYQEDCRVSIKLSSNGRSGYTMRLVFGVGDSASRQPTMETYVNIPEKYKLTPEQAEALRWELRELIADKMGEYVMKRGRLFTEAELQDQAGRTVVSVEGRERVLGELLEGRFDNSFIDKALAKKCNPFDGDMDLGQLRDFGGKWHVKETTGWAAGLSPQQWQLPQPLCSAIELRNPRPDDQNECNVMFTIACRTDSPPQVYERDVTVRRREDAIRLVKEINREFPPVAQDAGASLWTTAPKLIAIANKVDINEDRKRQTAIQ